MGSYESNYDSPTVTLASTWNGSTWSQAAAPGSPGSFLAGLSCSHRSFTCVAVGGQGSAVLALHAIAITTPASHEIKGYGGKCADDTGNSFAVRAKVQIWSCVNDAAQQWSFTGGELKHGSLCMNDQGNKGNGGHVILWNCNGASNEVWKHTSSSEYVLKSNGLCLDDPAYSTRNGTQLDVYRCHDGSNQHWSLP